MIIEFDIAKNVGNLAKHGMPLTVALGFEIGTALVWQDDRFAYGEIRYGALGYIGLRLHHMAFTLRGHRIRVISLRKANQREMKHYATL